MSKDTIYKVAIGNLVLACATRNVQPDSISVLIFHRKE